MCWLYVPGLEGSNSESTSLNPQVASSVTWRGKLMPLPYWRRAFKKAAWLQRLSGLTLPPSTAALGVESWICSLRASRVSPSPPRANSVDLKTNAGSGPRSRASLARWSPETSSWRTCQSWLFADWDLFSGPFPRCGSMRSGELSAAPPLAQTTFETDSGFLPTPTVCGNHNRKGASKASGDGLATAYRKLYPTPLARDYRRGGGESTTQVAIASLCLDDDLWGRAAHDLSRVDDGLPSRVDRIRASGNGVCPLAGAFALRTLAARAGYPGGRLCLT